MDGVTLSKVAAEFDPVPVEIVGVVGVAVLVASAFFSRRLGVAAPIVLVLVGVALSLLPGLQEFEVEPDLILDVLLPPILYAAAIRLPWTDFRRNIGTIFSLSVVLVIGSALGTGFLLFALLPNLLLPAGVALGAVISPPDAVSATAVGRRLGLPPRLLAVLEGEGLVNDATALVLLTTLSSAEVITGQRQPEVLPILGQFLFTAAAAIVIGLLVGAGTVWVRARLDDPVLSTAVSLAVPFLAFAIADQIRASGVLAVVVAGLYTGHANPAAFSPVIRISDRVNWRTIQFVLENAVFLLIGLQIVGLIRQVEEDAAHSSQSPDVLATVALGLLAVLLLTLLRFLWVGPLVLLLRLREQHAEKSTLQALLALQHRVLDVGGRGRGSLSRRRRRYVRQRADLEQLRSQAIDWRGGVVLGWSGMRGVVTLAAAQTLDSAIPYRPQLVLIAFVVAVGTLLLQGGTLPALIRTLKVSGVDELEDRRILADLLEELSYSGLSVLDDPSSLVEGVTEVDSDVLDRVRQSSQLRVASAQERGNPEDLPIEAQPHRLYRRLRLAVLAAEREHLLELRSRGTYPPRIEAQAQALLDIEETRLRPVETE